MKVSVLTPTYNRAKTLSKLYTSLKNNLKYEVEIEWLIMDDGSNDNTKEIVKQFVDENVFPIRYFFQENQGKMSALNHLVTEATGEFIIECDSDDYLTDTALKYIKEKCIVDEKIYAYAFLKYDKDNCNIGRLFNVDGMENTMFDLYFKQGEDGEKALVFNTAIRKKYCHQLEENEKFVTEARLYHQMDKNYQIKCYNKAIMICQYQKDGYTKNIKEIFKKNPKGYYAYFKEIFEHNMKNVSFQKRLYVIKHYILFAYLSGTKNPIKQIRGTFNKILYIGLYLPGRFFSKKF